jgi:hypothetical protein
MVNSMEDTARPPPRDVSDGNDALDDEDTSRWEELDEGVVIEEDT